MLSRKRAPPSPSPDPAPMPPRNGSHFAQGTAGEKGKAADYEPVIVPAIRALFAPHYKFNHPGHRGSTLKQRYLKLLDEAAFGYIRPSLCPLTPSNHSRTFRRHVISIYSNTYRESYAKVIRRPPQRWAKFNTGFVLVIRHKWYIRASRQSFGLATASNGETDIDVDSETGLREEFEGWTGATDSEFEEREREAPHEKHLQIVFNSTYYIRQTSVFRGFGYKIMALKDDGFIDSHVDIRGQNLEESNMESALSSPSGLDPEGRIEALSATA
ncbi:hypothetical protein B0H11DRAFT_2191018 [Mycena galericulata]|nr:hypothetical protein B0H11DRAFT_2191018 [Mycena galericulata]